VWPLVTLLRQYCKRLAVLVPFRAHSAGTLISLGADEIVMLPGSELAGDERLDR
jgi:ClpP class serine protease